MALLPTRKEVLKDLWSRHVPDKNVYGDDGRVVSRVFQRYDSPEDAFFDCYFCITPGVVCRWHQIELRGRLGIRWYVDDVCLYGYDR